MVWNFHIIPSLLMQTFNDESCFHTQEGQFEDPTAGTSVQTSVQHETFSDISLVTCRPGDVTSTYKSCERKPSLLILDLLPQDFPYHTQNVQLGWHVTPFVRQRSDAVLFLSPWSVWNKSHFRANSCHKFSYSSHGGDVRLMPAVNSLILVSERLDPKWMINATQQLQSAAIW